jgi:ACS family allantoate permease-like MFS transporter
MYLIYGLITIVWGILILMFLPDTPMSAKFFTPAEKLAAIERLRANQTGIENKTFKIAQMNETLLDYKTWMMALLVVTGNIPTGAVQSYSSTLIKGSVSCK